MAKKTRKELQREFHQELYIAASLFKMKSFSNGEKPKEKEVPLDPAKLETRVNNSVNYYRLQPFPHPGVETQVIPDREPWPKTKQKNLLRDPDAIRKYNSQREEKKDAKS